MSAPVPDLSVIVVSWNVRDLLRACLRALPDATEGLAVEVIVVDNGSGDGSPDIVASEFPQVTLLRNAENQGFALANNRGIATSHGRYLVLLNSDTVAPRRSLAGMAEFMDTQPRAGAASPRLLRPDGTPQPYAYGDDPTPLYLFRRALAHRSGGYLHDWGVDRPIQAGWVSGACLVARRSAVDEVGGLDENIFMYFEDNDWCRRMRLKGWEVWYNPLAQITHIGGASLSQNPKARAGVLPEPRVLLSQALRPVGRRGNEPARRRAARMTWRGGRPAVRPSAPSGESRPVKMRAASLLTLRNSGVKLPRLVEHGPVLSFLSEIILPRGGHTHAVRSLEAALWNPGWLVLIWARPRLRSA